jgi:L-iditol 2-dehydrogenase
MKAAQLTGYKKFEFVEVDRPSPKEGQVLIKTERVSICGSDLRTYDRAHPEESYPFKIGAPCHESLGEVVESRSSELSVGDKVIVLPTETGGLIEYIAESPDRCIKIPGDGDLSVWMMAQPVGTVMYAIQQADSVLGKRVAILSQGAIGLAFAQLIARAGARQVIVTDILDYRLEAAKKAGATHTINAEREDVVAAVTEITEGAMVDIAIEACGRPETCNQVFQVIRQKGQAILFGMTHDEDIFPFDYNSMYLKIPRIIVTNSARAGENVRAIRECVDVISQGRLDLSHLVTHRMKFDDVQAAYDMYSEKRDNSIKVVMEL